MQDVLPSKGLSGGPGDPAALIKIYIQYDRLFEAGQIVQDALHQWLYTVSSFRLTWKMNDWKVWSWLAMAFDDLNSSFECINASTDVHGPIKCDLIS